MEGVKRGIPIFFIAAFPYCVAADAMAILLGMVKLPLSTDNVWIIFCIPAVFWIFALFGMRIFLKTADKTALVKINLLVRLLHIPAYVVILAMVLLCVATPFTWQFVIFMLLIAVLTVFSTKKLGLAAVQWCWERGILSSTETAVQRIFQQIWGLDLFSAVWLYRKNKEFLS